MKKQLTAILIIATTMISCTDKTGNTISLKQKSSSYQSVLSHRIYSDSIYEISLFFQCDLAKNELLRSVNLAPTCRYIKMNNLIQGAFTPYKEESGEFEFMENVELSYFNPDKLIFQATFFIDPNSPYYPLIAKDVERLKISKQDTVHIGTIQELKQTKPRLMNEFLRIDSVKFDYLYKGGFHHLILPIEMK